MRQTEFCVDDALFRIEALLNWHVSPRSGEDILGLAMQSWFSWVKVAEVAEV